MASNQNMTARGVISVCKPAGLTPLQTLDLLREKFPEYKDEKLSYAGRLDPLAFGVMLVLVGEGNSYREEYLGLSKIYQTKVLFGIATDTGDVLGLVQDFTESLVSVDREKLLQVAKEQVGVLIQEYPQFSSPKIAGKESFTKEVEIKNIELGAVTTISTQDLLQEIAVRIGEVQGGFRQDEILARWSEIKDKLPQVLPLVSFTVTTGSGVYIRSLSERLGRALGLPALAYTIERLAVGDYTIDTALKLE